MMKAKKLTLQLRVITLILLAQNIL